MKNLQTGVSLGKKKKINWIHILFIVSFMIIPVVQFLLFYVYVNISSIFMAFQRPENGSVIFVGFENFEWIFERFINGSSNPSDDLQLALVNTMKTFCVQIIMFAIGMFVSYFIYKKILGYRAFRVIFYLPSIISAVVVGYFYTEFMAPTNFFPDFLEKLYGLDYDLTAQNGNITGTLAGTKADYRLKVEAKNGDSNLEDQPGTGVASATMKAQNGDVKVKFTG